MALGGRWRGRGGRPWLDERLGSSHYQGGWKEEVETDNEWSESVFLPPALPLYQYSHKHSAVLLGHVRMCRWLIVNPLE